MNTHQKILTIEKYRKIMDTLQADLLTHFKVNGIKKTHLMFFLRDRLPTSQEMSNVAFYEKIKNSNRWKLDEVQIVLEYMNAVEKKEVVASFTQLIMEEVNKDIEKSPFQFKFLTSFYEQHFDLTFSSVHYQPVRWRYHLNELLELYRLIAHMETFKLSTVKA